MIGLSVYLFIALILIYPLKTGAVDLIESDKRTNDRDYKKIVDVIGERNTFLAYWFFSVLLWPVVLFEVTGKCLSKK